MGLVKCSAIVKCGPLSAPGTLGCSLCNAYFTSLARRGRKCSQLERTLGNQAILVTFHGSKENDGTLGKSRIHKDNEICQVSK